MRFWVVVLALGVLEPLIGQEHQRLAAEADRQHRWELGVDGSLLPLGSAWWAAGVTARMGYEWQRTWSLSAAVPYRWSSSPRDRDIRGEPGAASLGLVWKAPLGDASWQSGLGLDWPWNADPSQPRWWVFDTGWQNVQDPVLLGVSASLSVPEGGGRVLYRASLSLQEVLNDTTTWSIVASPQVDWFRGLAFWSLSLSWRVGWIEGSAGWSTGIATGTGAAWSYSLAAERYWDFP